MAVYVKLFTDFAETFDDMSDAEAGRLIKAVLSYGASGEVRTLSGGERLVFGIIRRQIDRDNEVAETHRAAGQSGGRAKTKPNQTEPNETKPNQIEPNRTKPNQTEPNRAMTKEKDKEEDNKTKTKTCDRRFTPPTRDEVAAYIAEKGYHVDPDRWMAYYESNGWRVGRNPMKDWRAAVVTWERNGIDAPARRGVAQTDYSQREYQETKPGELPDWYVQMLEDEKTAEAAKKAGVSPEMPRWLAESMIEEAGT